MNWKTQTIALTALEEMEIDGFEGDDHGFHFLKLVFSCAPMLKEVIVKLSGEVSSSDDRCTKIYDIFKAHPSVECNVDLLLNLCARTHPYTAQFGFACFVLMDLWVKQ